MVVVGLGLDLSCITKVPSAEEQISVFFQEIKRNK